MTEGYVVGKCMTMCPLKELKMRENEGLLHAFEILENCKGAKPRADPRKTIKSFSRSAAGQNTAIPCNIRPFLVLKSTIEFLFENVLPRCKEQPTKVYDFMFDRLRAVRQDMVIQNLPGNECIEILEPITRFHVYFGYCCNNNNDFDSHINDTHLQECLTKLLCCYNSCSEFYNSQVTNECIYLLLNLGCQDAMLRGFQISQKRQSNDLNVCLQISVAWYLKNFIRFFMLIKNLPVILLFVVSRHIPAVRRQALLTFSVAFSSQNSKYPKSQVAHALLYDSEEGLSDDCKYYNIKTTDTDVLFRRSDFNVTAAILSSHKQILNIDLDAKNIVNLLLNGSHLH